MAFSVKFLAEVKTDLTEAKKYYFKKGGNPLSEDFKAEINSEIDYIRKFPEHYQVQYQNLRRALVTKFPYAIFYQISENTLIIFAVLHTSQEYKKVHKRND